MGELIEAVNIVKWIFFGCHSSPFRSIGQLELYLLANMPDMREPSKPRSKMTYRMYGIANCDTVKKARDWLAANSVEYAFNDYKKAGIDRDRLSSGSMSTAGRSSSTERARPSRRCPTRTKPTSTLTRQST